MVDPLAALVAAGAAIAVTLLIVGLFGGTGGDYASRLGQYGTIADSSGRAGRRRQPASVGRLLYTSTPLAALNRIVERRTWSEELARDLARADLVLRPAEFVVIRVVVIVGAIAGCYALGQTALPTLSHPVALVGAAVVGWWLPHFWLHRRQASRVSAFNNALPDVITLIANGLRSGASLVQSIELVTREAQPPVSTEFARVVREVNLGLSLEQALANMNRRERSDDLELMTTAIAIQHQVGGNLAEILDTIAFTIRDRVRIKGEIRTLTAQQRASGYVVGFLPIGLIVILLIIAPRFMAPMFEAPPDLFGLPLGLYLLALGGVTMSIGFLVIRRIVDIDV
jgi:tight adherence protein B